MEEIINIISQDHLDVPASDEELHEHAKYLIENDMSHLDPEALVQNLKKAGMTKMAIQVIETIKRSEGTSGE